MQRIIVTGGAGYIGSHVCKTLAKGGFVPVTYDNLCRGEIERVKWGPFEKGDIRDRGRLKEVMLQYQPECVIHLAGLAYISESILYPHQYYEVNTLGSWNVLDVMRECGIKKLVFSSTCAVYGNPLLLPINEQHPANPINPYGNSKLLFENFLKDYFASYGISSIALRYFNAAGRDLENELYAEDFSNERIIPLIMQVAAGHKSHLTIFGQDWDTIDGSPVRDYIHVSDLANAHLSAIEFLKSNKYYGIFNVGTGSGYSILELISAAEEISGSKISIEFAQKRAGDPAKLVCDANQIRQNLGWQPKHSDLLNILTTAWSSIQERRGINNKLRKILVNT